MRLAEALVQRADQQRKIAQLKQRLERVVKVQEGDVPSEDPHVLLNELHETIGSLSELVKKINKTNSFTVFSEGKTLADVLAERDRIMQERSALNEILEAASVRQDVFSRSEVRFYRTIEVSELQKKVDELSKSYRELDFKIQEKNWTIDLIES
ncbi:DIP1984 family protein [Saccharibacillus sacchari]|uniref:DIP1984 family protein n=1 Tax=Saccharibacillus sacchari TaxID=456493 RepID=A0ACC6P785_9BACL